MIVPKNYCRLLGGLTFALALTLARAANAQVGPPIPGHPPMGGSRLLDVEPMITLSISSDNVALLPDSYPATAYSSDPNQAVKLTITVTPGFNNWCVTASAEPLVETISGASITPDRILAFAPSVPNGVSLATESKIVQGAQPVEGLVVPVGFRVYSGLQDVAGSYHGHIFFSAYAQP